MHMDLVKRNADIVALVKARKMPVRKIAARYRLSTLSANAAAIERHALQRSALQDFHIAAVFAGD